ncbi:probable protein phosphatase 2C 43 [Medicago truncatula]|nr:probable protein phosphatase 2C 43 [Medicago truncatula]
MRNDNFALFDEDPLGRSINLQSHCYGEFSSAVVQANTTMEDQSQIEVASNNALFLGIYDGHGGTQASRFICEHLFKNLLRFANDNENDITEATLRNAVSATEEGFLDFAKMNYMHQPNLGYVGSCCLAGIIWKETLHVANLGDSRVVIGTMVNKKIRAEQLTRDHNCNDEAIREELRAMHPDDPNVVINDNGSWRVKGFITVSRAIGDAYLKRSEFTLRESFPKLEIVPEPFTRGVLSAEPEMHTRVLTDNDQFIIFASDGLWDFLSNKKAAEIVRKNPRNGIAKRLLSTALAVAAKRRKVTYRKIQAAATGRNNVSRRSFHDDISVIVVFLDKTSFPRQPVLNLSYTGSSDRPVQSDFAQFGLTTSRLDSMRHRSLKDIIQFESGSSHASSSQGPRTPLALNPQTLEGESSRAQSNR